MRCVQGSFESGVHCCRVQWLLQIADVLWPCISFSAVRRSRCLTMGGLMGCSLRSRPHRPGRWVTGMVDRLCTLGNGQSTVTCAESMPSCVLSYISMETCPPAHARVRLRASCLRIRSACLDSVFEDLTPSLTERMSSDDGKSRIVAEGKIVTYIGTLLLYGERGHQERQVRVLFVHLHRLDSCHTRPCCQACHEKQ